MHDLYTQRKRSCVGEHIYTAATNVSSNKSGGSISTDRNRTRGIFIVSRRVAEAITYYIYLRVTGNEKRNQKYRQDSQWMTNHVPRMLRCSAMPVPSSMSVAPTTRTSSSGPDPIARQPPSGHAGARSRIYSSPSSPPGIKE